MLNYQRVYEFRPWEAIWETENAEGIPDELLASWNISFFQMESQKTCTNQPGNYLVISLGKLTFFLSITPVSGWVGDAAEASCWNNFDGRRKGSSLVDILASILQKKCLQQLEYESRTIGVAACPISVYCTDHLLWKLVNLRYRAKKHCRIGYSSTIQTTNQTIELSFSSTSLPIIHHHHHHQHHHHHHHHDDDHHHHDHHHHQQQQHQHQLTISPPQLFKIELAVLQWNILLSPSSCWL